MLESQAMDSAYRAMMRAMPQHPLDNRYGCCRCWSCGLQTEGSEGEPHAGCPGGGSLVTESDYEVYGLGAGSDRKR
jgi:hypothetical protein